MQDRRAQARPRTARLDAAAGLRPRGMPADPALAGDPLVAGHHADRARRGGRPGARARQRRRRLCVKPFSLRELCARLRAVIRRAQPSATQGILRFADVASTSPRTACRAAGRPVHLGPTEFRLLRYLMQHPGRVFSREQLLDAVWGHDVYVEARTVDVHIRRLRKASTPRAQPTSCAPSARPATPSTIPSEVVFTPLYRRQTGSQSSADHCRCEHVAGERDIDVLGVDPRQLGRDLVGFSSSFMSIGCRRESE